VHSQLSKNPEQITTKSAKFNLSLIGEMLRVSVHGWGTKKEATIGDYNIMTFCLKIQ